MAGESAIRARFLELLGTGEELIWHNGGDFDLPVLAWWFPDLRRPIFESLEREQHRDTLLREQLLDLSTLGQIKNRGYSLSSLTKKYLKQDVSAHKTGPDIWRLRYSELDEVDPEEWPQDAIDYAILDPELTYHIYKAQEEVRRPTGRGSINTEGLQIASAFFLRLSTATGIRVDQEQLSRISEEELRRFRGLKEAMVDLGYGSEDNKGNIKLAQAKLRKYLETEYLDLVIRTVNKSEKTGKINISVSLSEDDLHVYPEEDEVVSTYLHYKELEKNCTTYYPRLQGIDRLYPTYETLKATGRTSSRTDRNYPSANIQNQPTREGVRECFVAEDGHLFLVTDYCTLELCCVADTTYKKFGWSGMRDAINAGVDLHSLMGSRLMGITYEQFIKRRGEEIIENYRKLAKPINLGFPGGLGAKTMVAFAGGTYDVRMTVDEAKEYRKIFFEAYPEVKEFMDWQTKRYGFVPKDSDLDQHNQYYEVNGRFRANCTFCQHANGKMMQSPAADGAKRAGFELTRAFWIDTSSSLYGSRMAWFVHDEYGTHTRADNIERKMEEQSRIMIVAMSKQLTDTRIQVETAIMRRWSKKGPFIKEVKYG